MKKIFSLFVLLLLVLGLSGCNKQPNIEGSLSSIMKSLYSGVENKPTALKNYHIGKDEIERYIGTSDIKWKEAIASESQIMSIAHSVVLIRMSSDATTKDIQDAKNLIMEKANPNKWICVGADEKIVESNGNLIILIMTRSDIAPIIQENFLALGKEQN